MEASAAILLIDLNKDIAAIRKDVDRALKVVGDRKNDYFCTHIYGNKPKPLEMRLAPSEE